MTDPRKMSTADLADEVVHRAALKMPPLTLTKHDHDRVERYLQREAEGRRRAHFARVNAERDREVEAAERKQRQQQAAARQAAARDAIARIAAATGVTA